MDPLVSIILPTFNALDTLPRAIGSLLAQTYENWEAVVVDDGSADRTGDFFATVRDPRIRFLRNERNLGRSHSRQRALDVAKGQYIALLDADDWLFPDRIEQQVAALVSESGIRLVSSGMAIADIHQRLVGVRGFSATPMVKTMRTLGPSPVTFAASMFRRIPGQREYFNTRFPYTEDSDFMIRLLIGQRYLILPTVAYVYCEHASASVAKMTYSHFYMARSYYGHRARYPWRSILLASTSLFKAGFWLLVGACGLTGQLINRRSLRPSPHQIAQYLSCKQIIDSQAQKLLASFDGG